MWRVPLLVLVCSTAACSVGVSSCSSGFGADTLVIASGEESTGEAAAGYALARLLKERAQVDAAAAATTGASDSMRRLREGRADLALVTADVLADAVNGQGAFKGQTVAARALATFSDACLHLIVQRDSPINGVSSLRGSRISTGPEDSATELIAMRVLREARLDPQRDLVRQSSGHVESLEALKENRVDAVFWLGAVPLPRLQDAVRDGSFGVKVLSTASVVSLLQNRFGQSLYSAVESPGGMYGDPEAWASVGVAIVLVARPDLPEALAHRIVRGLHDGILRAGDRGAPDHPVLRGFTTKRAGRSAPAALHPGAARFYREIGW